jgi:hypothetical protein
MGLLADPESLPGGPERCVQAPGGQRDHGERGAEDGEL